jgi:predicted nucleic acid-binding protein
MLHPPFVSDSAQLTPHKIKRNMKVYFDNCSLQRPLDDKSHIRIALEAEAILGAIILVEMGKFELISSETLLFEVQKTPNVHRQRYVLNLLNKGEIFIPLNDDIKKRAQVLNQMGIKPVDALHLASAEAASADYFCTCDDRFLKKAKKLTNHQLRVVSPLELIEEIDT